MLPYMSQRKEMSNLMFNGLIDVYTFLIHVIKKSPSNSLIGPDWMTMVPRSASQGLDAPELNAPELNAPELEL